MAAWDELRAAGSDATIIEARGRVGGRIFTARHSWANPHWELGTEFVHGKPKITAQILKRAGLKTVKSGDKRLLTDGKGLAELRSFWDIIEKVDGQIGKRRETTYAKFLARAKGSAFEKRIAKSYVEGFNAAEADVISTSAVLSEDKASAEIEGEKQFRIPEGYDSLLGELIARLPSESLHLETVVAEIRWRRGGVEVAAATPTGPRAYTANAVIATLPLGVLKARAGSRGAVSFVPALPEKEEALRHLHMGKVVKVILRFKERFWERHGHFAFAMALDAPFQTWWTQEPAVSDFLTGWAGGPAADRLAGLTRETLLERALESLALVFGEAKEKLRGLMEDFFFHDWNEDPFSRGAYSYQGIGGLEAARVLGSPVEDTLFFAGEATDFEGASGTVHAALESGRRAAREVIAAFGNGDLNREAGDIL
ncbi:MAG TPA: NAD(P)/FAD-dependent oxidoreductase [Chthoniobacteraceae bacterium]|nr:NAD(P)/FAD-dependent oxidoreductase [Chthoniobacteraceae bacterium]